MSAATVKMTEAELLVNVLELAELLKYRCAHFRPGMNRRGQWSTAMSGTVGFPDLVLTRDRVIFAELKSSTGRVGVNQQDWLHALSHAGAECHVWYPRDWTDGTIEKVLGSN
jgi:VRR-NUC domain